MSQPEWLWPGARWWKCDLHTHTPASTDYGKGPNQESVAQISPADWLLRFMRAHVDCVAVTDHNSGEWIDQLKDCYAEMSGQAAAGHPVDGFRRLTIFPGVEIAASGGVHVLGILEVSKASADVAQLLGAVRFHGTRGASDRAADASPKDVVHAIAQAGGIPILAHADKPCGAFSVLPGSTLAPLLDTHEMFAIELCDRANPKPDVYRQRRLAWAEVLGSDAHHPEGIPGQRFPGSHFTWAKMGAPSLDGLRLALLDGNGVSICRSDDEAPAFQPSMLPKNFIESVEIANGRFIGRRSHERLEFTPWFNALVGGRGTGKSTIIHFVRLAYKREGELQNLDDSEPVARTFQRFARAPGGRDDYGGFSSDGSTTATVTVMRDGERYRLNWGHGSANPLVEEADGAGWRTAAQQVCDAERFPLQLFSQGQIAALSTEGGQSLIDLIDDAVRAQPEKEAIQEAVRRFLALQASIRDCGGKVAGRDALHIRLEDVGRKLEKFELAHHAAVLKMYQLRKRQEREIERQLESASAVAGQIDDTLRGVTLGDVAAGDFDREDAAESSALTVLARLNESVRRAVADVREERAVLARAVEEAREALRVSPWYDALQQGEHAYEELIAMLKSQGVADPSEYGKLVQDRQRLEQMLAGLDALDDERQKLVVQAEEARRHLGEARRALSDKRVRFLREMLAENPFVRITVEPYGRDPRVIERSLRDVLEAKEHFDNELFRPDGHGHAEGAVADFIDGLPDEYHEAQREAETRIESLKASITRCCEGAETGGFGARFAKHLEREVKQRPEFLDRVLTWYPEDSLRVEYSPKGDGREFRSIEQASAGQRAAAMLAFLLARGDEPLILDQPEDDLDNHVIYDLVVKQIRACKQRRQIIVVTHNPNVVVNGDAEMIHALDVRDGQCCVVHRGCLQDKSMREEICRVMEGGREAFARRWRRLGAGAGA